MTTKARRHPAPEQLPHTDNIIDANVGSSPQCPAASPIQPATKAARVIALLATDEGATVAELCAMTGWQPHSCRAFFTGLRKNGRMLERSHRADGASVYKLVATVGVAQ